MIGQTDIVDDRWGGVLTGMPEAPDVVRPRSSGYSRGTLAAVVLVASLKIWLTSGQVLRVIWDSDERTFLLQVQGLLSGKWLGDYTIVSLVKAPFYALFMAFAFLLGIPTLFAQQLMYVLACSLLLVAVRPAVAAWRSYQVVLLYALLVFNPMSFLGSPRLLRNHLYASLTLLLLACSVAIVVRASSGRTTLIAWSVACGIALSAVWLTREESLWLIPFLVVFTAVEAWHLWQAVPGRWPGHLFVLGLPYGLLALSILTVSALNQRHYGVFVVNEFQGREFRDAFGAIYRVTPRTPRRPYVVAPKEIREHLYAVSPAFAELKGGLEGEQSKPWATQSCNEYKICGDNDVVWGWFPWEFRDAVGRIGYHDNAVKAARFYERVAAEINAACDSGRLECIGRRSSLLPPWNSALAWALPGAFLHAFVPLVTFRGFGLSSLPSVGPPEQLAEFGDISREDVAKPRSERFSLTGWVLSTRGAVELSVRNGTGQVIESHRRTFPRPDVQDYIKKFGFNVPHAIDSGFVVSGLCSSDCYLLARTAHTDWVRALPIDGSVRHFQSTPPSEIARAAGKNSDLLTIERGDVLMYLDFAKLAPDVSDRRFQGWLRAWKLPILQAIGAVYQKVVPMFFVVALVLFLVHVASSWTYRVVPLPDVIAFLALMLVCSRTLALAFTDIVAIQISQDPDYANAGYPLVLLFGAMLLLKPKFRITSPVPEPPVSPLGVPASPVSGGAGTE